MSRDLEPRAVALRYDAAREPAPRVVASGRGAVAAAIIALAREHGIAVHPDPDLLEVLAALDPGELIPDELYAPLAEVLAFVYRMNGQYPEDQGTTRQGEDR